ncbi:hypothetical protein GCM10020255_008580 [Rhodococcus baikonurensis]
MYDVENTDAFGFDPLTRTTTFHTRMHILARIYACMDARSLACTRQRDRIQRPREHRSTAQERRRTPTALIEDVKKPREFAASRRQILAVISASFVRDIRLLGFRFSLFDIQGVGGVFAGVRLPRLTHPPTATAGRWSKGRLTVI